MNKVMLSVGMVVLMWAGVPCARAEFALGDQDRVVFFGNQALGVPDMPMGTETFIRIRYPGLKARFRTYGRHEDSILKNVIERFERQAVPFKPTVVVLCFATNDVPRQALDQNHLDRFKADFAALVERAKQTAARLYVMTPLCAEVAKSADLAAIKYDETVEQYGAAMRTIAQEKGAKVIDWSAAAKEYLAAHGSNPRLALTTDGAAPTILAYALGMATILEAWGAEPCKITVNADWNSPAATASLGQAAVTKVGEDKIQLKLSGMPIPWVVPRRGAITSNDWPGSKYYSFTLQVNNVPEGGIMISEPGGKNALPYLSEQLRQGADMDFVGPLTKLEAVTGLAKWLKEEYDAVGRHQDFMQRPIPEPEYKPAFETYYLGLEQYAAATDLIVMRQPTTVDVTLELSKAVLPAEGTPTSQGEPGAATRPAKKPPTPRKGEPNVKPGKDKGKP
jgi:hypothetical protein